MSRTAAMVPAGMLLSAMAMTLAGCGGPDAGGGASATAEGAGKVSLSELRPMPVSRGETRRLVMLLPADPGPRVLVWEDSARKVAAVEGAVFNVRRPGQGETLAGLVRDAARDGASALIVAPEGGGGSADRAALGEAMLEARRRGVPSVTILDRVEAGGETFPVVVRGELRPAADELVAAVQADAGRLGRSASGPALLFYNGTIPDSTARAEEIRAALDAAGIALVGGGPVDLRGDPDEAKARVRAARAEHPDLGMVLTAEDHLMSAVVMERNAGENADRFAIAGFVVDPTMLTFLDGSFVSAMAFADEQVLGSYAARNALALTRGEPVPDPIVTPLPARRAPGPPASVPPADMGRGAEPDLYE